VGRLHSWAPGCRRAGPAWWSAASSRLRDMHNYALDQTLPCCYGTMVLIARAQGLARIKAAGQRTARDEQAQSLRSRVWRQLKRTIVEATGGARDNSHSGAFNQSERGPIARATRVVAKCFSRCSVGRASTRARRGDGEWGMADGGQRVAGSTAKTVGAGETSTVGMDWWERGGWWRCKC
jgi:hypothetical protein